MNPIPMSTRQRSAKLPSGITLKMQRFAEGVADGLSAADAYRAAFNTSNMRPKTVRDEASRLLKNRGISAAITALRAEKSHQQQISRQKIEDRLWERLWGLIEADNTPPSAKVKALTLAAKLTGMLDRVPNQNPGQTAEELDLELKKQLRVYGIMIL